MHHKTYWRRKSGIYDTDPFPLFVHHPNGNSCFVCTKTAVHCRFVQTAGNCLGIATGVSTGLQHISCCHADGVPQASLVSCDAEAE